MKILTKFNTEFEEGRLADGSRVFLFRRKGMPIHLRAIFKAGSRFDLVSGTAHFVEHMLLAGTEKFPTKNLIADHIHRVGGDFGANTDSNALRFIMEIPEQVDVRHGIEIASECLTHSLFKESTIENERKAIVSELQAKRANPKDYIYEVNRRLVMQGTPVALSTLGNKEEVESITREKLMEFKNRYITANNVTYIASGDVEMHTLIGELNRIGLPVIESTPAHVPLPIQMERVEDIELYPGVSQLQVAMSTRTEVENYSELVALKVLNNILSLGRGSRLITRVRYEKGLVYSIGGSIIQVTDWGMYRIMFSCDRDNLEEVKKIILQEFESLRKDGVNEEELDKIKLKTSKGIMRQLQTSESWVEFHENECVSNPSNVHTAEDYVKEVNLITKSDIQRVIDKYLLPEKFYYAICGDVRNTN
jgi:predicted Zn-dependent peptidase